MNIQTVNHFIRGHIMSVTRRQFCDFNHPYYGPYDTSNMRTRIVKPHLMTAVSGAAKFENEHINEYRFGEDSWFVANAPGADVLGVADGVGGWRALGIDSGEFAKQLMHVTENLVLSAEYAPREPRYLLEHSYHIMKEQKKNIFGSSTACLVSFNRENSNLYAANLGDSGFIVVRNDNIILQSKAQHHSFNVPFQLSVPPPHYPYVNDSVQCIETYSTKLEPGDVIMMATDGVFDNLSVDVIVSLVKEVNCNTTQNRLQIIANSVAYTALTLSRDENFMSPFAEAAKACNLDRIGGKQDDITVVLATVSDAEKCIMEPARLTSLSVPNYIS